MFRRICEDLLSSVQDVCDENVAYKTLVARYHAWKKLFKPNRTNLSEFEIQGLIGELLFMRDYAIPQWGIDAALESWTGPEKTHKDFSIGNEWYEIKTITTGKDTVRISSIEQLDSDLDGVLCIYSLEKMSASFKGIKLNALVKELCSNISLYHKDLLLNKLELYGYDFDSDIDKYVYALTDKSSYSVTTEFPRLERSRVPLQISKALYDIVISELAPFRIKPE